MNISVIGGSGFIGTRLVDILTDNLHSVQIIDKHPSDKYPDLVEIVDIRDKQKLSLSLQGCDTIYHLAAEHKDDVQPVSLYYDVNVEGTRNLIKAAEENFINRIIFTSSVAVYGFNRENPCENDDVNPENDYGQSKYEAEQLLKNWQENEKGRFLNIIRPAVIFGENNRGNVYNLLKQIVSGRFIKIGAGSNYKSMGYVQNLADFLYFLLHHEAENEIYNYADKPDLTMNELITLVDGIVKKRPASDIFIPYSLGLAGGKVLDFAGKILKKKYAINSERIKKFCATTQFSSEKAFLTGFKPGISLSNALELTIKQEFLSKDHS